MKKQNSIFAIMVFAIVATALLVFVAAVSSRGVVLEAEQGSSVAVKSDPQASQGKFVEFRNNQPPLHGCQTYNGWPSSKVHEYIAPTAGTNIPIYDTAWKMLGEGRKTEIAAYFKTLKEYGFTGAWTGLIDIYQQRFNPEVGESFVFKNGHIVLNPAYKQFINDVLDIAHAEGLRIGLIPAWQASYLPGSSNGGTEWVTKNNAYQYGQQIVEAFGDHPALSMWIFGGDPFPNDTVANRDVWARMACGVRDTGNDIPITYHSWPRADGTPHYAGQWWMDFFSAQTGHVITAETAKKHLQTAMNVHSVPVWQGEPRYFNNNYKWIPPNFRNPGLPELVADARVSREVGVGGHLYGDGGRWNWCTVGTEGDATPCNSSKITETFGAAEAAVIDVFR